MQGKASPKEWKGERTCVALSTPVKRARSTGRFRPVSPVRSKGPRGALTRSQVEAVIAEAGALLGCPLKDDLIDPETGEVAAITIVTDNGPAYKSDRFQRFTMSRPELRHVRTKHRSPQTNGVIERFFESLKYEHLYRLEIANAWVLGEEIESFASSSTSSAPMRRLSSPRRSRSTSSPLNYDLFRARNLQKLDSGQSLAREPPIGMFCPFRHPPDPLPVEAG